MTTYNLCFLPTQRCASADISRYRVSVCVSVTRRYFVKTAKRRITPTTSRDSPGTLSFLTPTVVGWRSPFPLKFALKMTHPFLTPRFRPISAHSTSTVRAGEKSWPHAFQRAIDEPCTLPLIHPKGGTKHDFAVFAGKNQLLLKEVCYKVSLCENFQRHCCSYIIPLSNGP